MTNKTRSAPRRLLLAAVAAATLAFSTGGSAWQAADPQLPPQAQAERGRMSVLRPVRHGNSARLRDYVVRDRPGSESEAPEVGRTAAAKPGGGGGTGGNTDPNLQTVYPPSAPPVTLASFDGITWDGSVPPDTNLAVGATQVVEVVNSQFAIFDKGGNLQAGPSEMSQMFVSLGDDPCATKRGGDPVVLYDRLAGRWLVARYVFATNNLCVAISQTSDATGAYHLYNYYFGPNTADYPKFGVWPDAYYFTANTFAPNNGPFMGAQACAFDRAGMLTGASAAVICFQGNTQWHSLLPADLDSNTPPPAGSPNYFLQSGSDALGLFKFRADFATPANSTFTGPTSIPVGKYSDACFECVPQPGVTETLESLSGRLMYRLSYRNFGTYESLLVNHTVQIKLNASGTQTGIRWYEIRTPNGTPTVWQQSTYSPDTTTFRWMGSIAQDRQGNMFLGYSASSATVSPSIRYAVRLATDPRHQMQREGIIQAGLGSQVLSPTNTSGRDRWGDYASVSVDPVDGCTMWFATEYLMFTGYDNWATHLFSVRFPTCS